MLCDPAARVKDGKLNSPWSGPLKILEKLSDALYRVELKNGKDKIINTERLKKFYPRSTSNELVPSGARKDIDSDSEDEHSLIEDLDLITQDEERENVGEVENAQPKERSAKKPRFKQILSRHH